MMTAPARSTTPRYRAVDWQVVSADSLVPVYEHETDRWQQALDWDTTARWADLERRRRQGLAPGAAVLDERGEVVGWSTYIVRQRVMQIGAFSATNDMVGQVLADRLLSPAALTYVDRVSLTVFSDYAGLAQLLRNKGLSVDRYFYLGREVTRMSLPMLPGLRSWRSGDVAPTAALLQGAYQGVDDTRPCAPGGTPDEWAAYVKDVIEGANGAVFMPDASLCLPAGPDKLGAVVLVSRVSDSTAHVSQIAVDPQMRRRRMATQLLDLVSASIARAGCREMTVVVGGGNRAARAMFEGMRFRSMGSFLSAGALQPRRSTSVAPGVAVMTRR